MATKSDIAHLETVLARPFNNKELAVLALTAADRTYEDISDDGNRKMSPIGGMLIGLVIYSFELRTNGGRAEAPNAFKSMSENKCLSTIAIKSGLDRCIKASTRQQHHPLPSSVLEKAIKAIIAAVWIDSSYSWSDTRGVMARLASFSGSIPQALADTASIIQSPDPELIEPARLSTGDARFCVGGQDAALAPEDDIPDLLKTRKRPYSDPLGLGIDELSIEFHDSYNMHYNCSSFLEDEVRSDGECLPATGLPTLNQETIGGVRSEILQDKEIRTQRSSLSKAKSFRRTNGNVKSAGTHRFDKFVENEIMKWDNCYAPGERQIKYLQNVDQHISECNLSRGATVFKAIYLTLASSGSVLNLQEVLKSYRRNLAGRGENKVRILSIAERYSLIESLGGDLSYIVLQRRYHTLMLYIDCLNECAVDMPDAFKISTQVTESAALKKRRGNPRTLAEADVTKAMIEHVFPDSGRISELERNSRHRRVSKLRAFGKRLYLLKLKLGIGVLALLLPGGVSMSLDDSFQISDDCIMGLRDEEFEKLVELLADQNLPFRKFGEAAEVILQIIVSDEPDDGKRFALEGTSVEDIMRTPSGSEQLLRLLRKT